MTREKTTLVIDCATEAYAACVDAYQEPPVVMLFSREAWVALWSEQYAALADDPKKVVDGTWCGVKVLVGSTWNGISVAAIH